MLSENVLTIACQNPKTAFVMLGIIVYCSPNFLFCNNNYLLYEWGLELHTLPSKLEAIISAPKHRS